MSSCALGANGGAAEQSPPGGQSNGGAGHHVGQAPDVSALLGQVKVGDSAASVGLVADQMMAGIGGKGDQGADVVNKLFSDYAVQHKASFAMQEVDPKDKDACLGEAGVDERMFEELKNNSFYFATRGSRGNPMAGRWQRFLESNPAERKMYDELDGIKKKAEFRQDWCKGKYDNFRQSRTFTKTSKEKELKDSKCYAFARIAQEEGGGDSGVRAAACYAIRCMRLGAQWLRWCEWTQQIKFLYLTHGFQEVMEKAWITKQTWMLDVQNPDACGVLAVKNGEVPALLDGSLGSKSPVPLGNITPQSDAVLGSAAIGTPQVTTPAPRHPTPPTTPREKGGKKRQTSEIQEAMTMTKKLRTDLTSTLNQASIIIADIDADHEDWVFAKHESISGALRVQLKDVEKLKESTPFIREVLTVTQIPELKKVVARPESELITSMNAMKGSLEEKVKSLRLQCNLLLAQKDVRREAKTAKPQSKRAAKAKRAAKV